jgi:hypothetical protein
MSYPVMLPFVVDGAVQLRVILLDTDVLAVAVRVRGTEGNPVLDELEPYAPQTESAYALVWK